MTPAETIARYRTDAAFHQLTDALADAIRSGIFTRDDVLDAAALACLIDEQREGLRHAANVQGPHCPRRPTSSESDGHEGRTGPHV